MRSSLRAIPLCPFVTSANSLLKSLFASSLCKDAGRDLWARFLSKPETASGSRKRRPPTVGYPDDFERLPNSLDQLDPLAQLGIPYG